MMTKIAKTLLSLTLGLALFGTSAQAKQTLRWSEPSEIQTLDPALSVDTTSSEMMRNSYEGLYRFENNGQVKKALVKKETRSADGLTYTFTLQKNAKWSNGDRVTAKDFVYSWQRAVDPNTKASNAQLFDGIKNAAAIMAGKKAPTELGVSAVSDHTLKVELEKPLPYFRSLVVAPIFSPLDQKAVEKYGKDYGTSATKAVTNGPFNVKGWTGSNQKWQLVKNKHYWDKKQVKLDQIDFLVTKSTATSYNMFQSGQLDKTDLSQDQARQLRTNKEFIARKQARMQYLQFNTQDLVLKNLNVRKALAYAIDRKQLVNSILADGSLRPKSFVPYDLMTYNAKDFAKVSGTKAKISFDRKKAQHYLKLGLKELGKDELELQLLGDDDDISKKVNEYLQSQLEENLPHTKVTTLNINKKSRIERMKKGEFEIVLTGWGADYQDATSFLNLLRSDSPYNFGKWQNPDYDKLLTSAKEQTGQKRFLTLLKADELLTAEQAVTPLYQPALATLLKKDVKHVIYAPIGGYNFKNVTLK